MASSLGRRSLGAAAWEFRALWSLVSDHKAGFAALVALGLAASFVETLSVSLVVSLLYRAALGGEFLGGEFFGGEGFLSALYHRVDALVGRSPYALAAAVASAVLLRLAFVGAYEVIAARVSNAVHDRLRVGLFTQYMSVAYEYILAKDYGELTNTLQVETWRVSQAVEQLSRILINACAVLVYMVVLLFISWPVALAATGGGAAVVGLTQLFRGRLRGLSREATRLHEELAERMFSSIHAMRTIRVHGAEGAEIARFAGLSRAVARVFVRLAAVDNACRPVLEVSALAAAAVVVWVSNEVGNPVATTVAILALLLRLQPRAREMQRHITSILGAGASLDAVVQGIGRGGKPYPVAGTRRAAPFERELAFRDVTYVHAGSQRPSLDRVGFTIGRGMTAAVIGPSGAGKTTVVNLLLKLYEPTGGAVTVDGVPLAEIERASWLERVAVAGQDIDLLEGTIMDNIRLARPAAGVEAAKAALRVAGILDFVERLPEGLHTRVGERGFRLSGGQRQRIGLARAIVGDPDILILDEATNAVDPVLESDIHAALRAAYPWLTIIVVAHRSGAIAGAELVVVLDGGRVEAVASPEALRRRGERA